MDGIQSQSGGRHHFIVLHVDFRFVLSTSVVWPPHSFLTRRHTHQRFFSPIAIAAGRPPPPALHRPHTPYQHIATMARLPLLFGILFAIVSATTAFVPVATTPVAARSGEFLLPFMKELESGVMVPTTPNCGR